MRYPCLHSHPFSPVVVRQLLLPDELTRPGYLGQTRPYPGPDNPLPLEQLLAHKKYHVASMFGLCDDRSLGRLI
jgi:hypothetical protein